MDIMESINNLVNTNPVLTMIISLGGAGIITFWLKDVPMRIGRFLKLQFTTELTMTSSHLIFHNTIKWIAKAYAKKNFRKLKVSNGKWGTSDTTIASAGYGTHLIWYKRRPLLINLTKESSNQTSDDKDTLSITKFGRRRKLFDELVADVQTVEKNTNITEVYKMESYWEHVRSQHKRPIDSVFIERSKRDMLLQRLNQFINSEDWYLAHGIPYQFGVLLWGPPGTGKTSLIKAVASYLNYPIYYLAASDLTKIAKAMSQLPDKCIVVIEDIDSSMLTQTREKNVEREDTSRPGVAKARKVDSDDDDTFNNDLFSNYMFGSLSDVLNALDGMFSAHGRILIATTNHAEVLDPALVRPGRIDMKIEVGYVSEETLKDFLNKFYPGNTVGEVDVADNITVADLQNLVLEGKTIDEILNYATRRNNDHTS